MSRRSRDGRFLGYCQQPPGWGVPDTTTGRCKLHGGLNPTGPDHGAFKHGIYSQAVREEDLAVLDALEEMTTARKLEDTFNLQVMKLRRAVAMMDDPERERTFWDAFGELVEAQEEPGADEIAALAKMLDTQSRALRDLMDLIRKTAKTLHDITDDSPVRHEHAVDSEAYREVRSMVGDAYGNVE